MHLLRSSSSRLATLTLFPFLAGNVPNAEPTPSIVHQINNIAPVKNASNPLVANTNPGSQLQFLWLDGDGTHVRVCFFLGSCLLPRLNVCTVAA
ncbi:hypothetical protein L210DRAFT_3542006 [Boletus edulis BED1]|uniref:Secreted protein n=1 Tax=Boletus edulis BED1 TaxID=1328754 RepID=A0AAD4BMC1_BOLED|nr:hypothetical protein L210DRAFT_3554106 [Boletus edulis BED1]KAF8438489.1 hypothetical protein L210DRAFT_3544089 [Boletus edulis BED1]KAF8439359.1 hypothetical protein L210DRAFT_3542006 [Boletus edulis BED1]